MITILNTSIITSPGRYDLIPVTLEQATEAVKALGHQSAPVNRQEYRQEPGGLALVFKLRGRPPEGAILSREELEKIGFDFFFLRRNPRVQEMRTCGIDTPATKPEAGSRWRLWMESSFAEGIKKRRSREGHAGLVSHGLLRRY